MNKIRVGHQAKIAALGVALVLPMTFAAVEAHATAIAYSAQQISNFRMFGVSAAGGFDTFEFNSNDLTVALGGFTSQVRTGGNCSGTPACVIDVLPIAHSGGVTPGFLTNNDYFTNQPSLNSVAGNFAVADSNMLNAAITAGAGGKFGAMAAAQTSGDTTGRANTGSENTMFWNLGVSSAELINAGGSINLGFSYDYLAALFLKTNLPGETASGTARMFVELINGNTGQVIKSIAADFNQTMSIIAQNSPSAASLSLALQSGSVNVNNAFTITTAGLYGINIKFENRVNVRSQVPEPASLALLSLGVLGMGAMRRRRKAA